MLTYDVYEIGIFHICRESYSYMTHIFHLYVAIYAEMDMGPYF